MKPPVHHSTIVLRGSNVKGIGSIVSPVCAPDPAQFPDETKRPRPDKEKLSLAGDSTSIILTAVQETGLSRYHGPQIMTFLKPLRHHGRVWYRGV